MLIKSFLAFGAGFISFLSPCVLPLIPGYISYISGERLGDIVEKQKKVILKTVLFSLGFSIVFISFGATASLIGNILLENSNTLRIIAGIIIIIFSLLCQMYLKPKQTHTLVMKEQNITVRNAEDITDTYSMMVQNRQEKDFAITVFA